MGLLRNSTGGRPIFLKRTKITIRCRKDPTCQWPGYLVLTERGQENIFFFSTKKLRQSDEVDVIVVVGDKEETISVAIQSCHDQVSSGRIMRQTEDSENPFPAKFYFRAYGQIQKVSSRIEEADESNAEAPVTAAAEIPTETVPEVASEPAASDQAA